MGKIDAEEWARLDTGATNAARMGTTSELEEAAMVEVEFAGNVRVQLPVSPLGTVLLQQGQIILPAIPLCRHLRCKQRTWPSGKVDFWHPERGDLPVRMVGDLALVPQKLALELGRELVMVKAQEMRNKGAKALLIMARTGLSLETKSPVRRKKRNRRDRKGDLGSRGHHECGLGGETYGQ